mmetsp:Transcript_15045/g.29628  ORF Transcript_15045/g.29628 Transcript_15045/m.29628 type:complete len:245 (-) Transcript_15045:598-1332(-)
MVIYALHCLLAVWADSKQPSCLQRPFVTCPLRQATPVNFRFGGFTQDQRKRPEEACAGRARVVLRSGGFLLRCYREVSVHGSLWLARKHDIIVKQVDKSTVRYVRLHRQWLPIIILNDFMRSQPAKLPSTQFSDAAHCNGLETAVFSQPMAPFRQPPLRLSKAKPTSAVRAFIKAAWSCGSHNLVVLIKVEETTYGEEALHGCTRLKAVPVIYCVCIALQVLPVHDGVRPNDVFGGFWDFSRHS